MQLKEFKAYMLLHPYSVKILVNDTTHEIVYKHSCARIESIQRVDEIFGSSLTRMSSYLHNFITGSCKGKWIFLKCKYRNP